MGLTIIRGEVLTIATEDSERDWEKILKVICKVKRQLGEWGREF